MYISAGSFLFFALMLWIWSKFREDEIPYYDDDEDTTPMSEREGYNDVDSFGILDD